MPQSRDYSGFFDLRHIQGVVNDIKYFFLNIEKELEKRGGGVVVYGPVHKHLWPITIMSDIAYPIWYILNQ